MARPAILPAYATDATILAGAQAGLSTRLSPGAGTLAQGFYQDRRLPARALAWLFGTICDWVGYLDDRASHAAMQTWRMSPTIGIAAGAPGSLGVVVGMLRGILDANGDQQRKPVLLSYNTTSFVLNAAHSGDGMFWPTRADLSPSYTPTSTFSAVRGAAYEIIAWGANNTALYTQDGGSTWAATTSTFDTILCYHYIANGATNLYIKATSNGGAWVYTGGPNAASPVFGNFPGASGIAQGNTTIADNGSGTMIACAQVNLQTFSSLFKSTDYGATWTNVQNFSGTVVGDVVYNKAQGVFVCVTNDTLGSVSTSTDGTGWSLRFASATPANGFKFGRGTLASAGHAIVKLWSKSLGGAFNEEGVAYSLDLGASWNFAPFGSPTSNVIQSISGFNGRIYAAGLNNVWVSGPMTAPTRDL